MIAHVGRAARTQRRILLGAAVLLGLVIGVPLAKGAVAGPYARAELFCPTTARRGTTVTVTGTGFQPSAAVTGSFTNPAVGVFAPTTTSGSGTFTTTAAISPTSPTGSHVLEVTVTGIDTTVTKKSCTINILA